MEPTELAREAFAFFACGNVEVFIGFGKEASVRRTPASTSLRKGFVIDRGLTVAELAVTITQALKSGGSVVTIYAGNVFESKDLDFVTSAARSELEATMVQLGFSRQANGLFRHPNADYAIDFEPGPVAVGEEILEEWNSIVTSRGRLVLLTPTQSVKDRLAWYYHSRDRPSLLQAVAVATHCEVDFNDLRRLSEGERSLHMYEDFLEELAR